MRETWRGERDMRLYKNVPTGVDHAPHVGSTASHGANPRYALRAAYRTSESTGQGAAAVSAQADIDTIVEALVEQRIATYAASIRAQTGQMVVYDPYEPTRDVLRSHGMRQVVTPTPVVYCEPEPRAVWWRRWYTKLAVWLVIAAAVIEVASWVVDTYLGGPTGLIAVCVMVLLAAACCRGGGSRGRTFTFTGTGRLD